MIDIDGFREYLYEEELSKNTVDTYIVGIEKYSKMFAEITKPNLIAFKKHLVDNFKPATVNLRIIAILRYCEFKGIPIKLKQVKEPKKTHIDNIISEEQFKVLIDGLKADGNERWYAHIMLLAKTGVRVSEAIRIKKKDVLAGSMDIYTKAHMRTIYFPKSLVQDIMPYLETIEENQTVMQNKKGEPITTKGVADALQRYAKRYEIPKEVMHPHAFRHFFAIEFLKRNNNIALLADLLGHGSVNVTQIYLRQSQEQQKAAIDAAVNW